jgi:hypothetical protein
MQFQICARFQLCMGSTWLLSAIGLILMLVDRGVDPLAWKSVQVNGHAAVGMAAFVLAFIQPFMAYFRPHPNTPRRPMFNVAHLTVGMSAILLAFVAIGLAAKFETLGLDDGRYLIGAFSAFYLIFHLILTAYSVKIGEDGKALPVFLVFFAVGALSAAIGMIVVIAQTNL